MSQGWASGEEVTGANAQMVTISIATSPRTLIYIFTMVQTLNTIITFFCSTNQSTIIVVISVFHAQRDAQMAA